MNNKNLYDNTLEELVEYYALCYMDFEDVAEWYNEYVNHSPADVMEVILEKFEPKVR